MRAIVVVGSLLVGIAACGSTHHEEPAATASLIVGVQSAELGSIVSGFHILVKHHGAAVMDETLPSLTKPAEISVPGVVGSEVEVIVDAINATDGSTLIERLAEANIVAGTPKLLRIRLETSCAEVNGFGTHCSAPETCIAGGCAASEVAAANLEDYTPGWASVPPPDICRPLKPGPPSLTLGTGQTDYTPLTDGQTLMLEQGPQGGHHIWMAVRMKNLRQEGSTTMITSTVEGDPQVVAPLSVVFAFQPDEGGYCKESGLRYQLDASTLGPDGTPQAAPDYRFFFGKRLDVVATVTDSTGGTATDRATVQIADKLVCADGTNDCNQ